MNQLINQLMTEVFVEQSLPLPGSANSVIFTTKLYIVLFVAGHSVSDLKPKMYD